MARFEEDLPFLGGPVVDVFEIEAGVRRHEQIGVAPYVSQRCDAVIARPMTGKFWSVNGGVVHNDRRHTGASQSEMVRIGNTVLDR